MITASARSPALRRAAVVLIALLVAGVGPARAEPRTFDINPDYFFVTFLMGHAGFSRIVGDLLRGEGRFVYDEETKTLHSGTITVYSRSVFTAHSERDQMLRGPDFLNVAEYPEILFEASGYIPATGDNGGAITGGLTLLGETHPLTFEIRINRIGRLPAASGLFGEPPYVLGASARATIDRGRWGMTGPASDLFSEKIELIIEFEAVRQPE